MSIVKCLFGVSHLTNTVIVNYLNQVANLKEIRAKQHSDLQTMTQKVLKHALMCAH